ncbi:MAG TPA: aspartate racemase [Clostridiales bacterium UBA8153]|nr:aspartate racemase [Clostridiales bacterium UBA8153]
MGPEATADLFYKIIRATPAAQDQDHLRVIVDCNPAIPDRTRYLLGTGPDPFPELVRTAHNLVGAGASFLVIPCNTAHYFHRTLQEAVTVPILHIMEETAAYIHRAYPAVQRAGLLASTGTVRTGLYPQVLQAVGVEVLSPQPAGQDAVMQAIYLVKAGKHARARELSRSAVQELVSQGAGLVILGCTELPLILGPDQVACPVVDPTQVLAQAAVNRALDSGL